MTNEELKKKICKIIECHKDRHCNICPRGGTNKGEQLCTDELVEELYSYVNILKAENNFLRERLKKVVDFARDYCAEDDCAGDDTVGIPPCEMWQFGDEDENGNWIKGGCMLEMWQKELAEEKKDD